MVSLSDGKTLKGGITGNPEGWTVEDECILS